MAIEVTAIFFEHGDGWSSRLIQMWTRSYWNHVGAILNDGYTIEAAPSQGIYRRLVSELPKEGIEVVYLPRYTRIERESWADCFLSHLHSHAEYDWLGVAWVWVTLIFPPLRFLNTIFGSKNAYFCAECVQRCTGIVPGQAPEATTPGDIARLLEVEKYA